MAWIVTNEGSILDANGKVLFFSPDHFVREIAQGTCCFLCGVSPTAAPFNDEHVIPDWVLRRYKLHQKQITLPSGSTLRYSQYKVPCCESCNAFMGERIEKPVADLFARGHPALVEELNANGPLRLFVWMNLLFLKTHLKDRSLRLIRDRRQESVQIGELYEWSELHHIHCVTRVPYTGATVSTKAVGTIIILPAKTDSSYGDFDYGDYFPGKTIFVRLGEVFLLCVLNDACGVFSMLHNFIGKITGRLSALQCREIAAHASYANLLIENRPVFHTEVDFTTATLQIAAGVPDTVRTAVFDQEQLGGILLHLLQPMVRASDIQDKEKVLEQLRNGHGLLLDNDGRFVERLL